MDYEFILRCVQLVAGIFCAGSAVYFELKGNTTKAIICSVWMVAFYLMLTH